MSSHFYRLMLVGFALVAGATAGAETSTDNSAKMAPKSDAEIVAILEAANAAEIEAAKIAQSKATDAQVKSFANMMIEAHSKNDSQGDALASRLKITPSETAASTNLKSSTQMQINGLKSKSGAEFDQAYVASQVAMHSQVESDLKTKLIPAAKNAEFKTFLQNTLSHVQTHLQEAKKLQAALAPAAPATTTR